MKTVFSILFSLLAWPIVQANNLQISNLQLDENELSFEVKWDNAWHLSNSTPRNHDAVWLIFKGLDNDGVWSTILLPPEIHVGEMGVALFTVKPNRSGGVITPFPEHRGTLSDRFTCDVSSLNLNEFERISIHAVEMVYVPDGAYYLGDVTAQKSFYDALTQEPFHVDHANPISVDSVNGLWAEGINVQGELAANYPTGFNGFYLMKYEISQAQYVHFLNHLTLEQQQSRVSTDITNSANRFAFFTGNQVLNRNGIVIKTHGNQMQGKPAVFALDVNNNGIENEVDDGQNRACNFLNFSDVLAYLDWLGLRPFTEMEFEKACRGSEFPSPMAFAWGTDDVIDANTVINDGTENEGVTESGNDTVGLASHGYLGPQGPLRNGFAAKTSSNRVQSGAGYYGNMELSGNLWELIVPISKAGFNFKRNKDVIFDVDGKKTKLFPVDDRAWSAPIYIS